MDYSMGNINSDPEGLGKSMLKNELITNKEK